MADAPGAGTGYREHRPAADLAPWVECFWTRSTSASRSGAKTHRVLPDGCADVIFDFGPAARAIVVGPMTRALVVPVAPGSRFVAVRFRPGAAGALLRVPLRTLVDRHVELRALWTDASARLLGLVEHMAAEPEPASIAAMAAQAGITRQHLRRVFEEHVGLGPKRLARILRLRRALRLLDGRGRGALASVALDAGYYDQAHMNADFRDLAGCPPLALAD